MAAIETLTGVTKINPYLYEVTSNVSVGANIDDVEFATFISKSGGILRFGSGCTTTFTRCQFTEETDAASLGGDNYANSGARFNGTCAAVFKGCIFRLENDLPRSDFDVQPGASPEFRFDDSGAPCYLYMRPDVTHSNHFQSSSCVMDGFVIDYVGAFGDFEARIPPIITNLTVIDNNPGTTGRHVVILQNQWASNTTYSISKLSARNVACWGGDATKILQLINPLGDILKATDFYVSWAGVLEVYRTYTAIPFDPVTKLPATGVRAYLENTDQSNIIINNTVSTEINENLFQYTQLADSLTVTIENNYVRSFHGYLFQQVRTNFTVTEKIDGSAIDDGTVLMIADSQITESIEATALAYTTQETAAKFYDHFKAVWIRDYDNTIPDFPVTKVGNDLVCGSYNVIIDGNQTAEGILTTSTITVYAGTFTAGIDSTGTVTVQDGALLDGNTFTGNVNYNNASGTTIAGVTCNSEFRIDAIGTTIINNSTIDTIRSINGAATIINRDANTTITNNPDGVTINAPTGQFDFTTLIVGSQIVVCNTGTQTEVYRNNSTGTSESTGAIPSGTYDYTIRKADYFEIRVTGVVVGTSPVSIQAQQEIDRAYVASSGLTFGTTATINTTTKKFAVTVATTVQNEYSFWKEAFIAESSLVNVSMPRRTFGSTAFILTQGYEYTSASLQYLSRDGFSYEDTGGFTTARWCAVLSQGVTPGLQVEYQQALAAAPTDAQNTGDIDQVIQFYGDATHGNFDYSSYLKIKAQANGYREARVDVLVDFGISTLEETLFVFSLATTAIEGLVLGDPAATGLTLTVHGTPQSYNAGDGAKDFSAVITDTGTNSGDTILREFNWNFAQDAIFQGYEPFDLPEWIVKNGSDLETTRGKIESDAIPVFHGLYITRDGTNPHPDFSRFQADDGTYTAPLPTLKASGFTAGSRVYIYNQTTDTDLYNDKVAGTSYNYIYTEGVEITAGDTIEIYTCFTNSTNSYHGTVTAIATAGGFSALVSEVEYTDYATKGIDGSLETEYVLDGSNLQLDINAPDNNWDIRNLSAWYRYQMFDSATALKDFFNALNTTNGVVYEFDTDKGNLLIDNLRADLALELSGYTLRRKDGLVPYLNPTTGGGHPEFKYRDDALAVLVGSGPLTPTQEAQLAATAKESTLTAIKGVGWTDETLKDIRDNTGTGLDEAALHTGLDNYANKDDYKADALDQATFDNRMSNVPGATKDTYKADVSSKADASELAIVKANQDIINTNVKKGSSYPVPSGPETA